MKYLFCSRNIYDTKDSLSLLNIMRHYHCKRVNDIEVINQLINSCSICNDNKYHST